MEKKRTKLPVISYSKITTYKDCPKKYKFAYIEKLPRVEKHYTIFGQFCHEVLETFHKYYLDDKMKHLTFVEAMHKAFYSSIDNWKDKITKEQLDEAHAIMLDYLIIVSAEKEEEKPIILSVEQKIWTPINDEIVLYGYIDRVQRDSDGIIHVVDYKTTKDPKYLKDRTQLLLYGYSLFVDDESIETIRTSYILLKHKMRYMTAEHTKEELIEAKDKLLERWRKVVDDKLFRATPLKFKCSFCDYINSCTEGQNVMFGSNKHFGKVAW